MSIYHTVAPQLVLWSEGNILCIDANPLSAMTLFSDIRFSEDEKKRDSKNCLNLLSQLLMFVHDKPQLASWSVTTSHRKVLLVSCGPTLPVQNFKTRTSCLCLEFRVKGLVGVIFLADPKRTQVGKGRHLRGGTNPPSTSSASHKVASHPLRAHPPIQGIVPTIHTAHPPFR